MANDTLIKIKMMFVSDFPLDCVEENGSKLKETISDSHEKALLKPDHSDKFIKVICMQMTCAMRSLMMTGSYQ